MNVCLRRLSGWLGAASPGLVLTLVAASASAQEQTRLLIERTAEERPALLVLGSAHLHNPGRDHINIEVPDVLTEARQAEIAAVVERLAAFRPTHIAVEWPSAEQASLDALYRDYREGRHELGRRELEQFGLRLAAKLGLGRVHAVDWRGLPPGDQQHYRWAAYGKANGHEARLSALADPKRVASFPMLDEQSIGTWLLQMNSPEALARSHRVYFDVALIGDGDRQPGANWVGSWYGRNLRIFGDLVRLNARPEDRILVIFGQGHAYLLRQFARESGAFRLVNVDEVLKGE